MSHPPSSLSLSLSSSTDIANHIISSTLQNVSFKLKQKQISSLAKKTTSDEFTAISRSFVDFLSHNPTSNSQVHQPLPKPIPKDSLSKLNITISDIKSPASINQSSKKSNIRKGSIPKVRTREESITKASIINRDKLQNFIKLDIEKVQQNKQINLISGNNPNTSSSEMQAKLRKYYLNSIQTQQRQQMQTNRKQQQQNQKLLKQQNKYSKTDRSITYDYNGKIMNYSPNVKLENILMLLRSRIGGKHLAKAVEKRKVEAETLNMELYESVYARNRKYSTINRENEDEKRREKEKGREAMNGSSFSPSFEHIVPKSKKSLMDLKLSEYRIQNRKYRSIQTLNHTTRPNHSSHFDTRNNNNSKNSNSKLTIDLQSSNVINTMPSRTLTKTMTRTQASRNQQRFKTESLMSNKIQRTRLSHHLVESSPDIIYLNPELYRSMING